MKEKFCTSCGEPLVFTNKNVYKCSHCEKYYTTKADGFESQLIDFEELFQSAVRTTENSLDTAVLDAAIKDFEILGDYNNSLAWKKRAELRRDFIKAQNLAMSPNENDRKQAKELLSATDWNPSDSNLTSRAWELQKEITLLETAEQLYKTDSIIKLFKAKKSLESLKGYITTNPYVRELKQKIQDKTRKLIIKKSIIATLALILFVVLPIIAISSIASAIRTSKENHYYKAGNLYYNMEYEQAAAEYKKLRNYKDSKERRKDAQEQFEAQKDTYSKGIEAFDNGNYELAIDYFIKIVNYADSQDYIEKCISGLFEQVSILCDLQDYEKAHVILDRIEEYKEFSNDTSIKDTIYAKRADVDQRIEEKRQEEIVKYIEMAEEKRSQKDYSGARDKLIKAKELFGEDDAISQEEIVIEKDEFLFLSSPLVDDNNIPEAAGLVAKLSNEALQDEDVAEKADVIRKKYNELIKLNVDSVIHSEGLDVALGVVEAGLKVLPGDSGLLELKAELNDLQPKRFDLDSYTQVADSFYKTGGPYSGGDRFGNSIDKVYRIWWEWDESPTCSLTYSLEGKYKRLEASTYIGEMFKDYDSEGYITITILGDGRQLSQIKATKRQGAVPFSIDLRGVQKLEIQLRSDLVYYDSDFEETLSYANIVDPIIQRDY